MYEESPTRRPLKSRGTAWAKSIAKWLGAVGLRPNHISLLSILFAAASAISFVIAGQTAERYQVAAFLLAGVFIQLRLLCNLFDGMVAVEGGFKTKSGEIYNELPDRISDAFILIAAGYSVEGPESLYLLGWLAALMSIMTAYIRALGASAGSAQYFVGPMAKPHRMALMTVVSVAMAVLMIFNIDLNLVHPGLALISFGCVVTSWRRLVRVVRELESI